MTTYDNDYDWNEMYSSRHSGLAVTTGTQIWGSSTGYWDETGVRYVRMAYGGTKQTVKLDVSDLTGERYVYVGLNGGGDYTIGVLRVYEIWMEYE